MVSPGKLTVTCTQPDCLLADHPVARMGDELPPVGVLRLRAKTPREAERRVGGKQQGASLVLERRLNDESLVNVAEIHPPRHLAWLTDIVSSDSSEVESERVSCLGDPHIA